MKLGFVILVYGKSSMAKECIDYLLKLEKIENTSIVVVDNCSPDNTYSLLVKWYNTNDRIHIIHNESNQGFAKGNNLGYAYAREKLKCDCIVVMNSDVYIKDRHFIIHLKHDAQKLEQYEVIGPDIVNPDGCHSNPLSLGSKSNMAIRKEIFLNDISVWYYKLGIYRFIKRSTKRRHNAKDIQYGQNNIVPHGACVIYTARWIEKEKKAFYPGTFLFCEEFFLYDYIQAKGYQTIYWPDLIVNHIGDGSINGEVAKKKIFINSCHSKSLSKLLTFRKNIINNWEVE